MAFATLAEAKNQDSSPTRVWTGQQALEMACCHLVLALHNTKQHQIRPFQRVVWEEWQRLTCEPAVHDEGVPGSQGTQANSAQAGDRLLLRVEVLVACSFTPKKALHLRHTAGTSGSSGSRSMLVPSNICSMG